MATEIKHFIGGKLVAGKSGRFSPVFNPATGEQSASVPLAGPEEMAEAVALAKQAFPKWASTPPLRRARILYRFLRLIEQHQDRIAAVITAEHGKVLSDALGELARGVEVVEFATAAPQLLKGDVT
jgi:malonate-semialdehyde dehydrogenase (acetylating)/methylmalonate-semialdehyde dehydrogenase